MASIARGEKVFYADCSPRRMDNWAEVSKALVAAGFAPQGYIGFRQNSNRSNLRREIHESFVSSPVVVCYFFSIFDYKDNWVRWFVENREEYEKTWFLYRSPYFLAPGELRRLSTTMTVVRDSLDLARTLSQDLRELAGFTDED